MHHAAEIVALDIHAGANRHPLKLQIREKQYATELMTAEALPVHEMAGVFDGKRVWVRKLEAHQ